MEESTKKSTVSWQEALLYFAIAALLGGGIFGGGPQKLDSVLSSESLQKERR